MKNFLPHLAVWAAVAHIAGPPSANPIELSGKEQFKALLRAPPPVQLVFREKLPPVRSKPVPMDTGIAASTNYTFYELRWQTNGMFVRSLESTNDLASSRLSRVAFSLVGDRFCFLDSGREAFVYELERAKARRGQVTPPFDGAWYRITRYGEVVNLGLSHLWPGSVQWDGDRFRAEGIADKKRMFVWGEITGLSNGVPSELRVQYSNDMGVAKYRVAYDFDQPPLPFFPHRISLYLQLRDKEIEYRTYDMVNVATGSALSPEQFQPEPLVAANRMSVRYYTNDSIYTRLPSGRLLETPGAAPKLTLSKEEYFRNRYFYAASAALTIAFAVLVRKVARSGLPNPLSSRRGMDGNTVASSDIQPSAKLDL